MSSISGASNGEIYTFTKHTKRGIRYKLKNFISMAVFAPNNQHIIIGEVTKNNEQYHVFEIIAPSDKDDNNKIALLSQEGIETTETQKYYYVLLYDVGTENERIHALRENNQKTILLFESRANADFFVQRLKDQGFPVPTVELINDDEIKSFCQQCGYSWEIVLEKENKLIEQELHFESVPGEILPSIGLVCGPVLILWKFYINQHLYHEGESYVKSSHLTSINIQPPLYLETFTEDAEGYIMFFPDDKHIYYKLKIKISPLITKKSDWNSYVAYNVSFEEAQLLKFLSFQEQLFGTHHEQLIQTLDKLIQVYEAQGKEAEAETIMLRKLELEELYTPQEIILSANQSRDVAYTLFSMYRIPLQFLIWLLEINFFAGIYFLEKHFYTTTDGYPYSSYIQLNVSRDKIVDSQSVDDDINATSKETNNKLDLDIFKQINDYSTEITKNIAFL